MHLLKRFAQTASYITSIPFYRFYSGSDNHTLAGLSKYLPIVGTLIGILLSLFCILLLAISAGNHHNIVALLITLAWLVLTGGIHMDGLMDTTDGIASHQNRQRMLEIMADSRVGNFGSLAGTATLLTKIVSLAALSSPAIPTLPIILVFIPTWARWCETYAIGRFEYLRKSGKGKVWHDTTKFPHDVVLAALLPITFTVIACSLGYWLAAICSALTVFCGLLSAYWFNHKLGGQTGDTYGAVVELSETGGLLCCALIFNWLRMGI